MAGHATRQRSESSERAVTLPRLSTRSALGQSNDSGAGSFAYYHAARAALAAGGPAAPGRLGRMRADLLARVEADGTWLDTIGLGKAYATAMALQVLRLAEP